MKCKNKNERGVCAMHNLQCGFPSCEQEPAAPPVAEAIPAQGVASIDTPEFQALMKNFYSTAYSFAGSMPHPGNLAAVIAHINAAMTAYGQRQREAEYAHLMLSYAPLMDAAAADFRIKHLTHERDLARKAATAAVERAEQAEAERKVDVAAYILANEQVEKAEAALIAAPWGNTDAAYIRSIRSSVTRSPMAQVSDLACAARDLAAQCGMVLTVYQEPLKPLAMGHYETVVAVRLARDPIPAAAAPRHEADSCLVCAGTQVAFGKRCMCADRE